MEERTILKSQAIEVNDLIQKTKLSAADFYWENRPSILRKARLVSAIIHRPTAYFFQFELHPKHNDHYSYFSPGENTKIEKVYPGPWDGQVGYVTKWLSYLERELEAMPNSPEYRVIEEKFEDHPDEPPKSTAAPPTERPSSMTSEYNLTDNQKKLAKWIVEEVRSGKLEEEFQVVWTGAGVGVIVRIKGEQDDESKALLKPGNLHALNIAELLLLQTTTNGVRCTLTGKMYEAVDSDFGAVVEPEHPQAKASDDSIEIEIFISHNSEDEDIADLLVELFKNALTLDIEDIRCTSVRGHEFLAGTPIWEQIKADTRGAKVVIALLTPNSLRSTWVLIEIGARLMAGGPLIPVLAKGTSRDKIEGPLPTRTILDSSNEDDIDKLVGDLSKILDRPIRSRDSYSKWVRKILELNAAAEPLSESEDAATVNPTLNLDLRKAHVWTPDENRALLKIYASLPIGEPVYLPLRECSCILTIPGVIDDQRLDAHKFYVQADSRYVVKTADDLSVEGPGYFRVEVRAPTAAAMIPEDYKDKVRLSFQCIPDGATEPIVSQEVELTWGIGKGRKTRGDWQYPDPSAP